MLNLSTPEVYVLSLPMYSMHNCPSLSATMLQLQTTVLHISDIWNNTLKAEAQMLAPDTPPTPSHCFADDMDNNTCN